MLLIDDVDDGLGSLGKFKLKKIFKKLAPPAIAKKFVPPVIVPKQIIEKVPALTKLPGVVQMPTTVKEVKAMQKADIKEARAAYVENVMKPMSYIDPTMKKHYEHELRDNQIKDLRVKIDATEDPAQRQALESQLKSLEKKEAQYQKAGAIVRTIVSIAAMVIPVLAPIAIYIQLANAAYAAAKAKNNIVATQEAIKALKGQEAEAINHMVAKGLTLNQAQRVLAQIKSGVPVETAVKSVLSAGVTAPQGGAVVASSYPLTQEYKPVKLATPQAAQQAFLDWLKGYNPDAYDAVLREMPRAGAQSLSGYRDYSDLSGLGFWDTLATAASSIVSAASTVMKGVYDKRLMDLQIKQMQNQQAPLPTPVAQQVVSGQRPAPGGMPSWALPAAGVGLAGLLLFLVMRRRRGR